MQVHIEKEENPATSENQAFQSVFINNYDAWSFNMNNYKVEDG